MILKKIWSFCLFICLILAATGCGSTPVGSADNADTMNKVVSPQNRSVPLQGKWVIERCITGEKTAIADKKGNQLAGKTAEFTAQAASLGENFWGNVDYKIKRVNAEEYFLHKYEDSIRKLGITSREVYVITVSSSDNFLYEFVKINENEAVARIDDEFYCMKKISDETDIKAVEKAEESRNEQMGITVNDGGLRLRSGVLLGIRTPVQEVDKDKSAELKRYTYRTLWIASENRELHSIVEADDLFIPRKSGFWRLEVTRVEESSWTEDILYAYSISTDSPVKAVKEVQKNGFWSDRSGGIHKTVLYAGNDYVSLEITGLGKLNNDRSKWSINRLRVLPIDNLSNSEGIKISDIAGENGKLAMESAVTDLMDSSNVKGLRDIDERYKEQSIALFRKAGHWFFKGRINFKQNDEVSFTDYNINLIPPTELVAYDVLHLSWTHIKDRVPQALDAYTSPNSDVAVILTWNEILVYGMAGGELSVAPLNKVRLKDGDTVVMAEWATGDYVERWENTFIKNNEVRAVEKY